MDRAPLRGTLPILILLSYFLVLVAPVTASPYHLMEQNADCGLTNCSSRTVDATNLAGQSFIAQDGYNLTRIQLNVSLTPFSSLGPITLSLYSDAGGGPGITPLGSASASTSSAGFVWVNFDFLTPITLTKGSTYWMVAKVSGGTVSYQWRLSGSDTYLPGRSITGNTFGAWSYDSRDLFFRNYGYIEARIAVAKTVDKPRPQAGDLLHYRIFFNNTGTEAAARVWINDTLPAAVTYASDDAGLNGGTRTGNYNWTFTNVAQGGHSFQIDVTVALGLSPGTQLTNVVNLDYLNSAGMKQPGSRAQAAAVVGLRTKTLYLHETRDPDTLDTLPPVSTENCNSNTGVPCDYDADGVRGLTLSRGGSHDWKLHPELAEDFTLYSSPGIVLWLDDRGAGKVEQITVALYRNDSGSLLSSTTFSLQMDGVQGFQVYSLTLSQPSTTLPRVSVLLLRLSVPSGAPNDLQLAYDTTIASSSSKAFQSRLVLDTSTYIHITSARAWDRLGPATTFVVGENITWRATVADPFGSYDIVDTGTRLDLTDPTGKRLLTGALMALESTDPSKPSAYKMFALTQLIPDTVAQGNYTARVTANESNLVTTVSTFSFEIRAPVLQPSKVASPTAARPGDAIRYTIYFNNTGLAAAPRVWVNDSLPLEVAYASDNASASGGTKTGNYNWTFTNLTPGAHSFLLNVSLRSGAPGTTQVVNRVNVTYTDQKGYVRGPKASSAIVVVSGPYLTISKLAATPFVDRGQNVTFSLSLDNQGNQGAQKVWVNDTLPTTVTYASDTARALPSFASSWSSGNVLHFNFTNVSMGYLNFTVVVAPGANLSGGTSIINTATVVYLDGAGVPVGPATATATAYLSGPRVGLSLNLTASSTDPGAAVALSLYYDNKGLGVTTAYNVQIVLNLGPYLSFLNASQVYVYNAANHTVAWFLPRIFVDGSGTLTTAAQVRPGTPDRIQVLVVATVTFQEESGNPMPPNTSAKGFRVTAPVIDVGLRPDRATVLSGDILNYTLTFNNTGTGRAREVWINATLHPYTAILTVTVSTLGDVKLLVPRLGNRVSMHFRDLLPSAYVATLQVEIRAGLRDNLSVANQATLVYTDGGGNLGLPLQATAAVRVWAPVVTVALQADTSGALPGGSVNYTYSVSNLGHAPALNVWLNLTLDPDLLLTDWSGQGNWTGTATSPSWSLLSLALQEVRTITIRVAVSAKAPVDRVIPQWATATYTDSFGLAQAQATSNFQEVKVLSRPAGPFPWYYLLPLLGLLPLGIYYRRRMPRIHEVFVVYKDGSLLAHRSRTQTTDKDEDVLMAMFTAIQEFIKESFSYGSTRELKRMELDEYSVEIARGDRIYLAVIFEGKPTAAFTPTLQSLVTRLEADHREALAEWGGDLGQVKDITEEVACLFPRRLRRHLSRGGSTSQVR